MSESAFRGVLDKMIEQPWSPSFIYSIADPCSLQNVWKLENWYKTRLLEHSRLHLHIRALGPFGNFSWNKANIYLQLSNQTALHVNKGFEKVHIHFFESFLLLLLTYQPERLSRYRNNLSYLRVSSTLTRTVSRIWTEREILTLQFLFLAFEKWMQTFGDNLVRGNGGIVCPSLLATV